MQFSLHRKKSDGYQKIEHYPKETVLKMAENYRQILELIGEDPTREGLDKSPLRIAKAMQFMTQGYSMDPEEILRSAMFKEDYRQMVIVKDSKKSAMFLMLCYIFYCY